MRVDHPSSPFSLLAASAVSFIARMQSQLRWTTPAFSPCVKVATTEWVGVCVWGGLSLFSSPLHFS